MKKSTFVLILSRGAHFLEAPLRFNIVPSADGEAYELRLYQETLAQETLARIPTADADTAETYFRILMTRLYNHGIASTAELWEAFGAWNRAGEEG